MAVLDVPAQVPPPPMMGARTDIILSSNSGNGGTAVTHSSIEAYRYLTQREQLVSETIGNLSRGLEQVSGQKARGLPFSFATSGQSYVPSTAAGAPALDAAPGR